MGGGSESAPFQAVSGCFMAPKQEHQVKHPKSIKLLNVSIVFTLFRRGVSYYIEIIVKQKENSNYFEGGGF